jgi:hypothetical protein
MADAEVGSLAADEGDATATDGPAPLSRRETAAATITIWMAAGSIP